MSLTSRPSRREHGLLGCVLATNVFFALIATAATPPPPRIVRVCESLPPEKFEQLCSLTQRETAATLDRTRVVTAMRGWATSNGIADEGQQCISELATFYIAEATLARNREESRRLEKLAETLSLDEERYLAYAKPHWVEAVRQLESRLQTSSRHYPEGVEALRKELEALLANQPPFVPELNFDTIQVGAFGRIPSAKVRQIVDGQDLIADFGWRGSFEDKSVWITGVGTAKLVDGASFSSEILFKITGTKAYTTVLGASRTVYLAKPVDIDVHKIGILLTASRQQTRRP